MEACTIFKIFELFQNRKFFLKKEKKKKDRTEILSSWKGKKQLKSLGLTLEDQASWQDKVLWEHQYIVVCMRNFTDLFCIPFLILHQNILLFLSKCDLKIVLFFKCYFFF